MTKDAIRYVRRKGGLGSGGNDRPMGKGKCVGESQGEKMDRKKRDGDEQREHET